MPIGQFVELKLITNYICEDVLIKKFMDNIYLHTEL